MKVTKTTKTTAKPSRKKTPKLFNNIDESDILKQIGDKFVIGDLVLPKQVSDQLLADAVVILHSELWPQLLKDIKYEANKRAWEKAVSVEDIMFWKASLWIVDILEQKVKKLARIKSL